MQWVEFENEVLACTNAQGRIIGKVVPSKSGIGYWARAVALQDGEDGVAQSLSLGVYVDTGTAKAAVENHFQPQQQGGEANGNAG